MKAREKSHSRAAFAALLVLSSCERPATVVPPPRPIAVATVAPQVFDAYSASDRTWVYADGRQLRQAGLPELLQGVAALRADIQVELASVATRCGFQPLLAIDELFARARWDAAERSTWAATLRMEEPPERFVACLRVVAPDVREASLAGKPAWFVREGVVVWNDGVFVVASTAPEAEQTLSRMAHPEPASRDVRASSSGLLLSAALAAPNPFDIEVLGVRWASVRTGTRLDVSTRFASETSARQTESIVRDSLLQLLGSNASFDQAAQGVAERIVRGASVQRQGTTLAAALDLPPLGGQTAIVSKLTALAARGVRQHTAWDLTGEARETVFVIARALVDYATRSRGAGHRARFPPTAPLVPDEIPYGKRVVPNPHSFAHPSWQDIGFSSDRPTYYAYDFVTAKDGRSVVVRARGDIDRDGTTSLFELDVHLDAKDTPIIAPMIRERDAEE